MRKLIQFGIGILVIGCLTLAVPSASATEGETPPGWGHGKKTGWRGGHRPPGLAKKEGAEAKHKKHHHKKKHHEENENEKEEKQGTEKKEN